MRSLFESLRSRVHVLKTISLLWGSMVLGAGMNFFSQVLLARNFGVSEYGAFMVAFSAVVLFSSVAAFGVGHFWLKIFGKHGWGSFVWLKPSIKLVFFSILFSLLSLLIWNNYWGGDSKVGLFIFLLSPLLVHQALSDLVTARFQLEGRFDLVSMWQFIPNSLRFVVVVLVMVIGAGDISHVVVGFMLLSLLLALISVIILYQMLGGRICLAGHDNLSRCGPFDKQRPKAFGVFKESWPFALAGLSYLIYYQSDIILLGWIKTSGEAGIYNVAFAVMGAVYLFPSVVYQKYLLPKIHFWAEHDSARFLACYRFSSGSMLALGVLVALAVALIAPAGVPYLFGGKYVEAGRLLVVLAACIPCRFLSLGLGAVLSTQTFMKKKLVYMSVCALVNIALNLMLIPRFSYYGAAVATIATEVCLLSMYLVGIRLYIFGPEAFSGWNFRLSTIS